MFRREIYFTNTFKFHNVGQGLFYTGSLLNGKYNFVFDCGATNSNQTYLNKAIDDYVASISNGSDKPVIDMVVISHLHIDHFNGLIALAKKANIKKIFLPCLPSDRNLAKLILAYAIICEGGERRSGATSDNRILYNYMLRLYELGINDNDEYAQEALTIAAPGIKKTHGDFKKEDEMPCKQYWRFELFNKPFDSDVIKDLTDRLHIILERLDPRTVRDILYDAPKNIEQIAKIYQQVFGRKNPHKLSGGLNITSAILVHYPIYPEAVQKIICTKTCKQQSLNWVHLQPYDASTVSVLTGDAIDFVKYPNLISSTKNDDIFCLQVPHHGGKKNWDSLKKSGFPLKRNTYYVLSFGLGNTYGHPNAAVLEDLDRDKKNYFCVTQYGTFEYEIVVESIEWCLNDRL